MRTKIVPLSLCALALAVPILAITYGQPDGNDHPNVGALVGTFNGQTYPYCSGTLISPTVFLTAAHCDIGSTTVKVTFDSVYTSHSKLYAGTMYSDPHYNQAQSDPHDIAVVVLSKAINGLVPAALPAAGQLANAGQNLNSAGNDLSNSAGTLDGAASSLQSAAGALQNAFTNLQQAASSLEARVSELESNQGN